MREIKFRAWDGVCMYTPIIGQKGEIFRNYMDVEDFDPAPNDDLMQYSGMKDKNGKEIYEGDIARHIEPIETLETDWDRSTEEFGVITFDEITSCFFHRCGETGWLITGDNLEVIGNIYENPELLED